MNQSFFALASPLGNGIAIMRISGEQSLDVLGECFTHEGEYIPNMLYYGKFVDNMKNRRIIDECMAVYFAAPKSYTGEDCCEIHFHGSIAVSNAIMEKLSSLGLRLATPGEFSKRAFENGKMDLTQAEAVMDLISASARSSSDAALDQLSGKLGREINRLQDILTETIASIEAQIDYPDEEWDSDILANSGVVEVKSDIKKLIDSSVRGMILRDGYRVSLLGLPNAGKSTLMNTLLGYDRAIVTSVPGTTRDIIEESFSISGVPIKLIDSAGIRHSDEIVEKIGIDLAMNSAEKADLILLVLDSSDVFDGEVRKLIEFSSNKNAIILLNKSDITNVSDILEKLGDIKLPVVTISAKEGSGLEELESEILNSLEKLSPTEGQTSLITNQRHLGLLKSAMKSLESAVSASSMYDLDCVCIDLRSAWHSLGEISGVNANEEIIDRIFSKFCLGK